MLEVMSSKKKRILMDESHMIDAIPYEMTQQTIFAETYCAYVLELQDEFRGILDAVLNHRIKTEELSLMSHTAIMDNVNIRARSFLGILFSSKKKLMTLNRLRYIFISMLDAATQGDVTQIYAVATWCDLDDESCRQIDLLLGDGVQPKSDFLTL